MTASAIDKDGHLITDLTKDDFEVRDNGTVREIIAFRHDVVPFAVAIMVDISLSMMDNFATTRRAVTELVGRFEPGDRATSEASTHCLGLPRVSRAARRCSCSSCRT